MTRRKQRLTVEPRGLRKPEGAAYISVSVAKFDEMVRDGRMPVARQVDAIPIWDRYEIDEAFDRLPSRDQGSWTKRNT